MVATYKGVQLEIKGLDLEQRRRRNNGENNVSGLEA